MQCDMCDSGAAVKANIEGATMSVCNSCAKFGEIIGKIQQAVPPKIAKKMEKTPQRNEIITMINPSYSALIKEKREKMGLKQEELAKKLAEKVSVIHQLETGHMKPSIALARKLESALRITIIESYEEKGLQTKGKSQAFTIGDSLNL